MADTLVNLVTVPIYGRDPKFPKHKINKNSFAQWAIDVKHILKSYRALAREKLLPRDAITPSAKKALWITLPGLENVVQDYPTAAMANTTTDTGIRQRMAWHDLAGLNHHSLCPRQSLVGHCRNHCYPLWQKSLQH
jgi:hypothetical protein